MGTLFSPTKQTTTNTASNSLTNSSGTGTTAATSALPGYVSGAQQNFFGTVPDIVSPYLYDPNSKVAGLTPEQRQALDASYTVADRAVNGGIAPVSTAGPAATATAGTVDPGAISQFMNPYIGSVVNSAVDVNRRNAADAIAQNDAHAAAAGSFGGSRAAVGDAMIHRNADQGLESTVAGLLSNGWNTGANIAQGNASNVNATNNANASNTNSVNTFNAGATNGYNLQAPQVQQGMQLDALKTLFGLGTTAQQTQQAALDTPLKALLSYGSLIPQQYDKTNTGTTGYAGTSATNGTQSGQGTETSSVNPLGALIGAGLSFL